MSSENRRNHRVIGYAKTLHLAECVPGYIRDISSTGCHVSFTSEVRAVPGDLMELRVMPAHDPSIASFRITLRIRWVKADAIWFSVGGQVEALSNEKDKESFAQLLRYYES